mgnify:CR=1 FL=1
MNGRLPEGEPSHQPDAKHDVNGEAPSHHLLDEVMKGPRMWSDYFEQEISRRFPTGGYDARKDPAEATALRKTLGQLKSYEHHWLKKYAARSIEDFHSLELEEPEELEAYNELTFHLINQHIMSHWYRAVDGHGTPKPDTHSLSAAQVKLALESASVVKAKEGKDAEFEDSSYIDQQIADLDTMIAFLQLMIDAHLEEVDGIIAAPAPIMPGGSNSTNFLVFNPTHKRKEYSLLRLNTAESADSAPSHTPGHLAQIALARTKISSLANWPEFSTRASLHTFMVAKSEISQTITSDPAIEKAREHLGAVVRSQLFK